MSAAPVPAEAPSRAEILLSQYLESLMAEKNLSRFTLRNYATDLRHLFAHLGELGADPLAVSRLAFRSYLASMIDSGTAPGSVSRRVSTARSFYRWLRLRDVITTDPLANVATPKKPRRLPRVLTGADITNMIAAADGSAPGVQRDRALLEVLYGCGVRVSEAAGINLGDADLSQMSIRVRGKGNKERLVVMGGPARSAIERYVRDGRPALLRGKRDHEPASSALFVNRFGGRLSQRRIQLLVKIYALKAGIDERVHPHLLRHTFATHLLDGGAELRVVQELMGHSNPNTTQIYLHVTEERQRSEMERAFDGIAEVERARRAARVIIDK
jgi:site-specific recombinase XerD